MHMGICCLHWMHTSSVDGMAVLQNGHGVKSSSGSVEPLGGRRTVLSIFFLYLTSSWSRYSGLIKVAAYWNAAFFSPARSHSMTVEVRMGTTSECFHFKSLISSNPQVNRKRKKANIREGNLEMHSATRISKREALRCCPRRMCIRTMTYECNSCKLYSISSGMMISWLLNSLYMCCKRLWASL
jgi:hypothetical protein